MIHGFSALSAALPGGGMGTMLIAAALLSYFLGCLNGAVIVSKYILQNDVRNHGSGNAGLTNFYRTFGGKLTLAVIGLDVLKMVLAVFLSWALVHVLVHDVPILIHFWAGLWCALGHMYPCMFRFRGGKGILSGGTLALLLDWRIALLVWGVFILSVVLTRFVSLGSCLAAAIFPIISVLVYRDASIFLIAAIISGLILWQHRGNISRLLRGEESKFSLSRKKVSS